MWPQIIEEVIGRPIAGTPARLLNVRRVGVRGEVYPAIIPFDGGVVDGMLYENLSAAEMDALDRFEGPEYERRSVTLDVNGAAVNSETYFAADVLLLEDGDWSPESLSSERLAGFQQAYKGWQQA